MMKPLQGLNFRTRNLLRQQPALLLLLFYLFTRTIQIHAQCSGAFSGSCSSIELIGASTLQATCVAEDYSDHMTSLDLDEHVSNNNGMLICVSEQGQFSLSCTSESLLGSTQLSAQCLDTSSVYHTTSLDLDSCVQNSNGDLTWASACF